MRISTLATALGAAALALTSVSAQAAQKWGYVMTAPTIEELPDDDERAAATWLAAQPDAELIQAADLATVSPEEVSVLWVMFDRVGIGNDWHNLPLGEAEIAALLNYSAKGGAIYLSNHATMLADALGYAGEYGTPGVFADGEGGSHADIWSTNPFLGFDFRPEGNRPGQQGYYDRSGHAIYNGLELDHHNGWDQMTLALIGPGAVEDHNCMWDCNPRGPKESADVIAEFEKHTNSQVLATWGHVQDHCVAAVVDFAKTSARGEMIANGLAAYEWNQNDRTNEYQGNIEKWTANMLNYLAATAPTGVATLCQEANEAEAYYTLQGVRTANPGSGLYIRVKGGKATKVLVK